VMAGRPLYVAQGGQFQNALSPIPDQYEDVEDFKDTLLEESDAEFQRSLKKEARAVKRGRYLTHTELKLALANKKRFGNTRALRSKTQPTISF